MLAVARRGAARGSRRARASRSCGRPRLMNVALEAAASGQLVIGGFPGARRERAPSIASSISIRRSTAGRCSCRSRRTCAASWRRCCFGRRGGGRVAAREVLLNTPAVASVLAEGKTSQLPLAIEGGRQARHGAAQRRARRLRAERRGRCARGLPAGRRTAPGFLALLKRPGRRHVVVERLANADRCVPEAVYAFDERLQLLQQKLQHVLSRSGPRPVASPIGLLGFDDAPAARAAGVADHARRRRRSCRARSRCSPRRCVSDISRTLPPGVKTVNGVALALQDARHLPEERHGNPIEKRPRSRAPPRRCAHARSAAARLARSIVCSRRLRTIGDFHQIDSFGAQMRRCRSAPRPRSPPSTASVCWPSVGGARANRRRRVRQLERRAEHAQRAERARARRSAIISRAAICGSANSSSQIADRAARARRPP